MPGNAGFELLEPFFNAASDAIREVDDETIIFWEPVTYAYFVNVTLATDDDYVLKLGEINWEPQ